MKVAALSHSFPRFAGDTHGPFVKRLCEELALLGHQVHVLVPWDPELRPDDDTPVASISSFRYVWPRRYHLLGYSRTLKRDRGMRLQALLLAPLYLAAATQALTRLVRQRGIELMHAHWILPNGYVAARVQRATGVPYVASLHGSDVLMAEKNPLFRRLGRVALAQAQHVTSCSPDLRDRLLAVGGEEHAERVSLVPYGADLQPATTAAAVASTRAEIGVSADAPLVAAVGRLVDKKGFDVLLAAAPHFLIRPEVRLVIGGEGDNRQELERQAAALGIADRVIFTGVLPQPKVFALLAAADVFVMPSVRDVAGNVDGLPLVIVEAMAAGRPVVASQIAGIPLAVAEGETGRLVPERDPVALAAAINALLDDPDGARAMGEAGRARVERELTWQAIARRHDAVYGALARQR